MKVYKTKKHGSLLIIKACLEGEEYKSYPKLLIDTGSTFTVISYEILESIGCNPDIPKRKRRIVTGSGYEIAPVVIIPKFHCLGKIIENKEVLAHTLPFGSFVDGLLGMDFLSSFKIDIKSHTGELIVL